MLYKLRIRVVMQNRYLVMHLGQTYREQGRRCVVAGNRAYSENWLTWDTGEYVTNPGYGGVLAANRY